MDKRTKGILAWELHEKGVPHTHIAACLEVHRETVGYGAKPSQKSVYYPF